MNPYVLLALVALLASALIGGLLWRLWEQREQRDAEEKWQERERLLDRRRPIATREEILGRRLRRRRPTYRGRQTAGPSRGGRGSRRG